MSLCGMLFKDAKRNALLVSEYLAYLLLRYYEKVPVVQVEWVRLAASLSVWMQKT